MNHAPKKPSPDLLDVATDALRAAIRSNDLPPDVATATIRAMQVCTSTQPPSTRDQIRNLPPNDKRSKMNRILRWSGLGTAAAALVALLAFAIVSASAPMALAEIVEKVKSATSARFTVVQQVGANAART